MPSETLALLFVRRIFPTGQIEKASTPTEIVDTIHHNELAVVGVHDVTSRVAARNGVLDGDPFRGGLPPADQIVSLRHHTAPTRARHARQTLLRHIPEQVRIILFPRPAVRALGRPPAIHLRVVVECSDDELRRTGGRHDGELRAEEVHASRCVHLRVRRGRAMRVCRRDIHRVV